MPVYQFHIRNNHSLVVDEDGINLPDVEAAAREAIHSAHEFFAEVSWPTDMVFEVTDEAGRLVFTYPISAHHAPADEECLALAS